MPSTTSQRKCFERLDLVPKEALTLTIPALLKAEWMFCIVPFKNKAHAVYRAIYGEISENVQQVYCEEKKNLRYIWTPKVQNR